MAERLFKYFATDELIATVKSLGKAVTLGVGAQKQLRNSNTGFLVECAILHPDELKHRFLMGRVEIWRRGRGVDGEDADPDCAALEATDPRAEKNMRIYTVHC